jgi:hypothetical protein
MAQGHPRFPSQRVLPSLADRPMLAVRPGAALIPSHYQYRRKVVYDQPELAENSNPADLQKLPKNAKFLLLINDICGKLGSGIALALSLRGRGV